VHLLQDSVDVDLHKKSPLFSQVQDPVFLLTEYDSLRLFRRFLSPDRTALVDFTAFLAPLPDGFGGAISSSSVVG